MNLKLYSKTSSLMQISITVGEEVFKFNLYRELAIDEVKLSDSLRSQPQVYGFLKNLHIQLVKKCKELQRQKEKEYNKLYKYFYTDTSSPYYKKHQKFPNQNIAEALTINRVSYQKLCKSLIKSEADRDTIESCVKSFEQRSDLLRTLSSNIRAEKFN